MIEFLNTKHKKVMWISRREMSLGSVENFRAASFS